MTNVITRPEEVSPEWLAKVLRAREDLADTDISQVAPILVKKLQVSTICRLLVEYRSNNAVPRSLILKLGRAGDGYDRWDIGRAEVEFYKQVAPEMACPSLIRCYDATFDEETGRSHILLEDLTDTHSQPEQTHAPSEEMSRHAVEALAKLHAHWWSSPKLGAGVGKVFNQEWLAEFVANLNRDVAEFLKVASRGMSKKETDAYRVMLDAAPRIWGRLTDPIGLTVTHGDMHWWNFLYPTDAACHGVRLFDWHTWHIDLGARDLAFLLALGGFAEPRPEIEEGLLLAYHKALRVERYTWEMLQQDYRWSAIRNLNIPVIFWKQGKHESTWRTAFRRSYESCKRLSCWDLL